MENTLAKMAKFEEALREADTIASFFNSIGFYASPRRVIALIVLCIMTLRKWGHSWDEIKKGIVDLLETAERYERALEGNVAKRDLL